jgi:hypothetical protein
MSTITEAEVLTEAVEQMRGLANKCPAGTGLHSFIGAMIWEFEDWSTGEQEGTDE